MEILGWPAQNIGVGSDGIADWAKSMAVPMFACARAKAGAKAKKSRSVGRIMHAQYLAVLILARRRTRQGASLAKCCCPPQQFSVGRMGDGFFPHGAVGYHLWRLWRLTPASIGLP